MISLGFDCFNSAPVVPPVSLRTQWFQTEQGKKDIVYASFKERVPSAVVRERVQLSTELIEYIYSIMSQMKDRAKAYMRQEVVVTPAVIDAQDNVITPAVYNVAPATAIELRQTLAPEFIDDIPGADCNTIVNLMIASSNYTGNATWAFYSTNIKL